MAGREVLGAVAMMVLVGCSSETTVVVPNCGPGTVAKDGVCVPTTDASLDFGTPDLGGVDTSSDASADVTDTTDVADTVSDVPVGPEPCPVLKDTEELFTPFGSTCTKSFDSGGWFMQQRCDRLGPPWKPYLTAGGLHWTGAWIRTPDRPGLASPAVSNCTQCAEAGIYGITLEIDTSTNPVLDKKRVRVTLPAGPWFIAQSPGCWKSDSDPIGPQPRCRVMDRRYNGALFSIVTKDPNARAVNAFAEFVPEGTTCP